MTRLLNLLDEAEVGTDQEGGADQMEERRPFDKLLQAAQYGSTRFEEFSMLSCDNNILKGCCSLMVRWASL